MHLKVKKLDIKEDERGWLAEILRPEDIGDAHFGQILITTALPGKTKGNHLHKRKREWYCVLRGRGFLTVIDKDTGEKNSMEMGEHNMVLVEIPRGYLHLIENIGDTEMLLMAYTDEPYNPQDPDTFYESE